jgi:peptidoglycan/LPS O-acetylase OafA/YrhL
MSNPALNQSTYVPAVDGRRALSISLVILHHSQVQYTIPILGPLQQILAGCRHLKRRHS